MGPGLLRFARLAVASLLLAGCVTSSAPTPGQPGAAPLTSAQAAAAAMAATSTAFAEGGEIPEKYTCHGAGTSPDLHVTGAPAGAVSLALIMADPDAPFAPLAPAQLVNFTHWLVWNVPLEGGDAHFPAGAAPANASEGPNGGGSQGYTGPCPPIPLDPHRYYFTFFALDSALSLPGGANRAQLEQAMQGHVLASTALMGTYATPAPLDAATATAP